MADVPHLILEAAKKDYEQLKCMLPDMILLLTVDLMLLGVVGVGVVILAGVLWLAAAVLAYIMNLSLACTSLGSS